MNPYGILSSQRFTPFISILIFLSGIVLLILNPQMMKAQKSATVIKNIVIVHGALIKARLGWYQILIIIS